MKKRLQDLPADLIRGIAKGTQEAARNIVDDLKKEGPYTTGQFERAWEVNVGDQGVPAVLPDQVVTDEKGFKTYKGRSIDSVPVVKTPAFVPEPDKFEGYTIGNLMEYRDAAMDLKPGIRRSLNEKGKSLDPGYDWFTRYWMGSGKPELAMKRGMKKGLGMSEGRTPQ